MSKIYSVQGMCLAIAFLSDVASPGSCLSSSETKDPEAGELVVSAADCSCAPGVITVLVDGVERGTFTCDADASADAATAASVKVRVPAGAHQVSAKSASGTWQPAKVDVSSGTQTFDLGCPVR
jgi:hypothetical protein